MFARITFPGSMLLASHMPCLHVSHRIFLSLSIVTCWPPWPHPSGPRCPVGSPTSHAFWITLRWRQTEDNQGWQKCRDVRTGVSQLLNGSMGNKSISCIDRELYYYSLYEHINWAPNTCQVSKQASQVISMSTTSSQSSPPYRHSSQVPWGRHWCPHSGTDPLGVTRAHRASSAERKQKPFPGDVHVMRGIQCVPHCSHKGDGHTPSVSSESILQVWL